MLQAVAILLPPACVLVAFLCRRWLQCWWGGHEVWNPGAWEVGWRTRQGAFARYDLCECRRCGKVVDPKGGERFRYHWPPSPLLP